MVTSVLAIGVSIYLGQQHYALGPASCDIGELFSCSTVNKSEYSELFGIPIAFMGLGYYIGMLFLTFSSNEEGYESAGKFLVLTGAFSVLSSVALMYISAVEIKAWCLFCISLYGLNIIAFIGALKLQKEQASETSAFSGKSFGTAVVSMIAALVVTSLAFSEEATAVAGSNGAAVDVMTMVELLEVDLPLDGSEALLGSASATVQLVEFADFECPHCAMTAPKLKKLVQENSNVNLRFKQYPLSSNCNPNVQALAHENACAAAAATECANLQGKFWEMNKTIFKNQNYLSPTDIEFLAEQIGLDLTQFKACMSDESIAKGISADIEAAELVGVTGTPSIFLKGIGDDTSKWYKLDRNHTVEDLEAGLKAMSAKK